MRKKGTFVKGWTEPLRIFKKKPADPAAPLEKTPKEKEAAAKPFRSAVWIKGEGAVPAFKKVFSSGKVRKAALFITAHGIYEAHLNGKRVGEFVLAPGWTSYKKRLQYQEYDVTGMINEGDNELTVTVAPGWSVGRMGIFSRNLYEKFPALLLELRIEDEDGELRVIGSDGSFMTAPSNFISSDIYDGEEYDASYTPDFSKQAEVTDAGKDALIPQEGEIVKEQEVFPAKELIITPKGEKVIDFGQIVSGYVEFTVNAHEGDRIRISHAEVLDSEGNFYTENLRSAKQLLVYTCRDGRQTFKPAHTFFGFRYIRLDEWPEERPDLNGIRAIDIYSDMERTGWFSSDNIKINRLFKNIIYGQKGNFVDVPTDCPQRDERLGWTCDAQVFIRTATYNYDAERFFIKWLRDMKADQFEDGAIPVVIPACPLEMHTSSAWGDAVTICPWQLYLTYGNREILEEMYPAMKKWIGYIRGQSESGYLWDSDHFHFGDWLGLDAPYGSYKGSTDDKLVASAFYANSVDILIRAGKVLGYDVSGYEELYSNIVRAFNERFLKDGRMIQETQTACVLALQFRLAYEPEKVACQLGELVRNCGTKLMTGFVGTPYILHVLAEYGMGDLAVSLLLREEFPSWLFSVNLGATTVWEHWDGINEKGEMWSSDMNSFNHYAYGAVADFMYGRLAGINTSEDEPGFRKMIIKPLVDRRLGHIRAVFRTRQGSVISEWKTGEDGTDFFFLIPEGAKAEITIPGKTVEVGGGSYSFHVKA